MLKIPSISKEMLENYPKHLLYRRCSARLHQTGNRLIHQEEKVEMEIHMMRVYNLSTAILQGPTLTK